VGSLAHWYCASCQAKVSIHQAECPHCKQSQRADSDSVSPPATAAVGTLACWTCKSCGSIVDVRLPECPNCKQRKPGLPGSAPTLATSQRRQRHSTPSWVQAVSVPTALLGAVCFFLPWVQISCGGSHLEFSGYEIATGEARRKEDPQRIQEFYNRLGKQLDEDLGKRTSTVERHRNRPNGPAPAKSGQSPQAPILWIIPGACAILAVLGFFGLPRGPTIALSLLGAACLAYFGVSWESALTNPSVTGGVIEHRWLAGYWASWVGLLPPMILAMIRPRGAAQRD
jgi:hypothetical protein